MLYFLECWILYQISPMTPASKVMLLCVMPAGRSQTTQDLNRIWVNTSFVQHTFISNLSFLFLRLACIANGAGLGWGGENWGWWLWSVATLFNFNIGHFISFAQIQFCTLFTYANFWLSLNSCMSQAGLLCKWCCTSWLDSQSGDRFMSRYSRVFEGDSVCI